jgi:LysM repeat protein/lipoprotein-anchoring transpeptidase ErfK/SrfK
MLLSSPRPLLVTLLAFTLPLQTTFAQIKTSFQRIQPGYENAVQWRWNVTPPTEPIWAVPNFKPASEKTRTPEKSRPDPKAAKPKPVTPAQPDRSTLASDGTYIAQRGDSLSSIARKFGLPSTALRTVNSLTSDNIKIGQSLRIPLPQDPNASKTHASKDADLTDAPPAPPQPPFQSDPATDVIRLQVYLDRQNFPAGPIDGRPGSTFDVFQELYRLSRTNPPSREEFAEEALKTLPNPFAYYQVQATDLQFVAPNPSGKGNQKYAKSQPRASATTAGGKPGPKLLPPATPIEESVPQGFMAYPSIWDFVGERFHCGETFLRSLNPKITNPVVGTMLKVPNVVPFEVERCLDTPIQPQPNPEQPITVSIVDLSRLEVRRKDSLIAVVPMSRARPDLRGRGKWTILHAIAGPAFTTVRISRNAEELTKEVTDATPQQPLVLPRGPRNPLGILWLNLAKEGSDEPLPFGLHGTNIPTRMRIEESIGGFRLTNWDIDRTARLIPSGTTLSWLK